MGLQHRHPSDVYDNGARSGKVAEMDHFVVVGKIEVKKSRVCSEGRLSLNSKGSEP